MHNAKPLELPPARFRGSLSRVPRPLRVALVAVIACGFAQGCFVFERPARPKPPRHAGAQPPPSASAVRTPPAVEEESLPPENEIEGPPPPPQEDEMVGPPAPSAAPAASGEATAPPALEQPVQEAYASPRTAALLQGLTAKGIAAQASARGVVIILPESVFEYGTADLPKPSKRRLHDIASVVVEQASGVSVSVEGHTDSIGADMFNKGLSTRRARAVADELEAGGIAQSLLKSEGFGSQFPIAPNERPDGSDDPDGRARNRRVEIVIETAGAPRS